MKILYKIIAFFVSLVAIMLVLPSLLLLLPADAGMGMMFILFLVIMWRVVEGFIVMI